MIIGTIMAVFMLVVARHYSIVYISRTFALIICLILCITELIYDLILYGVGIIRYCTFFC